MRTPDSAWFGGRVALPTRPSKSFPADAAWHNADVPPLRVAAASSFADLLPEISRTLVIPVIVRFGATSVLHRQILDGLPVDLLFSADAAETRALERDRVLAAPVVCFARNRLVVIVPRDHSSSWRGVSVDRWHQLGRLAVGNLKTTASGREVRRLIEKNASSASLSSRLVQTATVRQALALVARGDVDGGIVFQTDRIRAGDSVHALGALPGAGLLDASCAVLRSTKRLREASRFRDSLASDAARGVLLRLGFLLP